MPGNISDNIIRAIDARIDLKIRQLQKSLTSIVSGGGYAVTPTTGGVARHDLYGVAHTDQPHHTHHEPAGDDEIAELPTSDEKAALDAAASPNGGNPFATMADVGSVVPTLAAVLAEGNDAGDVAITMSRGSLHGTSGDGNAILQGLNGDTGSSGASAEMIGGSGNGLAEAGSQGGLLLAGGGVSDGQGGDSYATGGYAQTGSGKRGGDLYLYGGGGDGAGRSGLIIPQNLPTADPGVAGALYSDGVPGTGTPKVLMVSGG